MSQLFVNTPNSAVESDYLHENLSTIYEDIQSLPHSTNLMSVFTGLQKTCYIIEGKTVDPIELEARNKVDPESLPTERHYLERAAEVLHDIVKEIIRYFGGQENLAVHRWYRSQRRDCLRFVDEVVQIEECLRLRFESEDVLMRRLDITYFMLFVEHVLLQAQGDVDDIRKSITEIFNLLLLQAETAKTDVHVALLDVAIQGASVLRIMLQVLEGSNTGRAPRIAFVNALSEFSKRWSGEDSKMLFQTKYDRAEKVMDFLQATFKSIRAYTQERYKLEPVYLEYRTQATTLNRACNSMLKDFDPSTDSQSMARLIELSEVFLAAFEFFVAITEPIIYNQAQEQEYFKRLYDNAIHTIEKYSNGKNYLSKNGIEIKIYEDSKLIFDEYLDMPLPRGKFVPFFVQRREGDIVMTDNFDDLTIRR